jgi:hypothetical protein
MVIFGRGRIHPPRILEGLDKSSPYFLSNLWNILISIRYPLILEIATLSLPAVARNDKNE